MIYVEKIENGSFCHTKKKLNVHQLQNVICWFSVIYSGHGPLYKVKINEPQYVKQIHIWLARKIMPSLQINHRRTNSIWDHLYGVKKKAELNIVLFRDIYTFVKLWRKTTEPLKLNPGKLSYQNPRGMWPIRST